MGGQVKYIAPFEKLKAMVTLTSEEGTTQVNASYDDFLKLLRGLISYVEVDERWYLGQYDDVARAIKDGTVRSAQDHFVNNGFFEGRLPVPIKVDERWYLTTNTDVAEDVQKGIFPSGQAHFDAVGYQEGRLPFPVV
jgi:hypothetical protein